MVSGCFSLIVFPKFSTLNNCNLYPWAISRNFFFNYRKLSCSCFSKKWPFGSLRFLTKLSKNIFFCCFSQKRNSLAVIAANLSLKRFFSGTVDKSKKYSECFIKTFNCLMIFNNQNYFLGGGKWEVTFWNFFVWY